MDHSHHHHPQQSAHQGQHSPKSEEHHPQQVGPALAGHQQGHQHHVHAKDADAAPSYDEHAGHHTENFLKRFWICTALTVPVLLLSHMIQEWTGIHLQFPGDKYVLLALSSIIYVYGGWPFIRGMYSELSHRNPGMMTLVAVAITAAYVYSTAVVFGLQGMDFYWELATLIDIMLLGHWLEMRSQMAASRALESLVQLMPSIVHVQRNGEVHDMPLKELRPGDIAIVKPGEKIPGDGEVTEGRSSVNESMLTGESAPVTKEQGNEVIGGSINGDGMLKVKVTGAGADSYLHKVINMVQSAQGVKSRTQHLAGRVAMWLTIVSLSVGLLTLVYWMFQDKDLSFALERMVTVMVTACPHALGVAIPLVVAISTSVSATKGLLIRNRTAFEKSRKITTVIFDKTGTLTKGSHEVQQVKALSGKYNDQDVLQFAAAVQQHSEHHIAQGIIRKLKEKNVELWPSTGFHYMQGMGVEATVHGKQVIVAGPNYFTQHQLPVPAVTGELLDSGNTMVYVVVDNEPAGMIAFADQIRETSAEAIRQLQEMHIKSFLLTGDNEKVAAAVSEKLSMDGYMANVLPHEKMNKVQSLQEKGEVVAMTGDGVNDAPALAQADVGIAVGSGTDVAAETADIILVNSDPKDVVRMIAFGRATYRKMIQNLVWAVGYNVVAIPLAAGILYPQFVLSPALGAVLMSASTIIVAINARLLKSKLE